MVAFAEDLYFNTVTPLTPTHYPNNVNRRPDILDIAPMKGVALKVSCIEPLQCLDSDHQPVLMRLVSLTEDCPPAFKTITNWWKVSTVLDSSADTCASRTHPCARAHGRPIMGFSLPSPPLSHGENYKKCYSDSIRLKSTR
ncbi:hypothetical protein EVAR_31374_1 [Eumeta japonica]|uniref:Endonuclease/exonuclease/phosphatase domain-containing protein n=1 Tax=Eumeta variegata TaxID=151549 RepID=A0A4C1XAB5_EUMVA|nr:hypothetical protein EVAR_31374_1 [Eumeta japonica]